MVEFGVVIIFVLWFALYCLEIAAYKDHKFLLYAWISVCCRPIFFCCGFSLFIIYNFSDAESSFFDFISNFILEISFFILGIILAVRAFINREKVEDKIKRGEFYLFEDDD